MPPASFFSSVSSTLYLLMKHNPLKSTSAGICQVIIGLVHLPGSTLLLFNITGFCDSFCRPICLNCKFFHICSCLFLSFKILLSFSSRPAVTLHPIRLFWSPSSLSPSVFSFSFSFSLSATVPSGQISFSVYNHPLKSCTHFLIMCLL